MNKKPQSKEMMIKKKDQRCFSTRNSSRMEDAKYRGFTLIELMIVVAIVAIVLSVAIPNYQAYGMRTNRSEAISNMLELSQWMERQFTVFGSYDDTGIAAPPITTSPKAAAGGGMTVNYLLSSIATPITYTITATPQGNQANDTCGTLSIDQASRECITGGTICSDDANIANRTQVRQCFTGK